MARYEELTCGQVIRTGIDNGDVTVLEKDNSGLISACKCATGDIPSAVAGYIKGCLLTNTTTGAHYTNTGSTTSCTFSVQSTVTPGSITAASLAADAVVTAAILDANVTPAKTLISEARTATAAPGGTTGVIADTSTFVVVTCDDANKVITLPTPTPGRVVTIGPNTTGYELRSSAPATVAINGGVEANGESAIGANVTVVAECVTATAWLCRNISTAGAITATQIAAA